LGGGGLLQSWAKAAWRFHSNSSNSSDKTGGDRSEELERNTGFNWSAALTLFQGGLRAAMESRAFLRIMEILLWASGPCSAGSIVGWFLLSRFGLKFLDWTQKQKLRGRGEFLEGLMRVQANKNRYPKIQLKNVKQKQESKNPT